MRFCTAKYFLAAVVALGAAPAAHSDPFMQDDLKWLETMAFAAHRTDYSGTFIYQYGNHVETSRITHVVDANGEHGRLESLDGKRREIIRNNGEVWCYMGDKKIKVEGHGNGREFPALLQDAKLLSRINRNYQVSQAGEARVAGFHAHGIFFKPRDNLRYAHKMWADSGSGLLLKAEVLDAHGNVVEQYAFTQLTLGDKDIDRSWIKPAQGGGHQPKIVAAIRAPKKAVHAAATTFNGWHVDAMPPGFVKIAEVRRPIHNRPVPALQMVYSDGLAGVSVFIEPADEDEDDENAGGLTSRGGIQIYSKMVAGRLVTVVGEVPPQTVIDIADSVRYGGE